MRVRAQKPDVVFDSFASAAESAAMYKSLQRFDVKAQRWAQNNLTATPKIWELAGDAVDGALVVDPIGPGNPNTDAVKAIRSEEHTSEFQSLMRNSYAVFCLHNKNTYNQQ